MTNAEAIERIQQKTAYIMSQIASDPNAKANFWRERDLDCFALCVAALEFAEATRVYEESAL